MPSTLYFKLISLNPQKPNTHKSFTAHSLCHTTFPSIARRMCLHTHTHTYVTYIPERNRASTTCFRMHTMYLQFFFKFEEKRCILFGRELCIETQWQQVTATLQLCRIEDTRTQNILLEF